MTLPQPRLLGAQQRLSLPLHSTPGERTRPWFRLTTGPIHPIELPDGRFAHRPSTVSSHPLSLVRRLPSRNLTTRIHRNLASLACLTLPRQPLRPLLPPSST